MGKLLWRFFKNPVMGIIPQTKSIREKKKKNQPNNNKTTPNKRDNLTLHFGESSGRWLITVAAAPRPPGGGVSWTPS